MISREYKDADTFYIFNHVDIVIAYHSGAMEDWGKMLSAPSEGGRIVCK